MTYNIPLTIHCPLCQQEVASGVAHVCSHPSGATCKIFIQKANLKITELPNPPKPKKAVKIKPKNGGKVLENQAVVRVKTPRERAEEIVKQHLLYPHEPLVCSITTALQAIATETVLKNRTFERRKVVRDMVTTSYSGDHATKKTQVLTVEVAWPEEASREVGSYTAAGEWRIVD